MRQVLTWRLLAALGVLVVAAVVVNAVFARGDTSAQLAAPFVSAERRPELIAQIGEVQAAGFAISDTGQATADAVLELLPDERPVRIFVGTPGEVTCTNFGTYGQCALLAELLGDTITWFAVVPMAASFRFELPAIEDLDGGLAHLANGWEVPYAPVIDRTRCANPGESFSDFLRTVGNAHRSLYDLGQDRIIAVTCPDDPAE